MIRHIPRTHAEDPNKAGFVQCDGENLPFRDGSFDYVVSMLFFHMLPRHIAPVVLNEFARVASRGVVLELSLSRDHPMARAAEVVSELWWRKILRNQTRRPLSVAVILRFCRRALSRAAGKTRSVKGASPTSSARAQPARFARQRLHDVRALAESADLVISGIHRVTWDKWVIVSLSPRATRSDPATKEASTANTASLGA